MKVLLTGAFGNVGVSALDELLRQGHPVRCFDLPTAANRRTARCYGSRIELCWGDLRRPEEVEAAVAGVDVVVHVAFILPKMSATGIESEERPDLAYAVNVEGTANLIAAMEKQPAPPRLIFTSSLHVYGRTQHLPPPRRVDEPVHPIEHYARHKVQCEQMIRASGLRWSILRLAATLPLSLKLDPGMFDVPLDNRMEYAHTRDVGLALANAVGSDAIWGRTLLIGGGARCQFVFGEIVEAILGSMGLEMLPPEAFATAPFATDWLDTEESQRLLHYQTRTLGDYLVDMKRMLGPRLPFVKLFRSAVRRSLLAQSPHWRRHVEKARHGAADSKTAIITGASSGIGAATARLLARRGYRVVLVARRAERLELLADEICRDGGAAQVIVTDLTDEEGRDRMLAQILQDGDGIDVLVNCAGLGWYGYGAEMPWPMAREMIQTNMTAVAHLTLAILTDMQRRARGHVINISSIAGSLPEQGIALYGATRSFVDSFTTSLYRELRNSPVTVSLVRLGPVRTEFYDRAARAARGREIPGARFAIAPDRAARAVVTLLQRPRRVVNVPAWGSLTPWVEPAFGWLIDLLGPALLRRPAASGAKE